MHKLVILIPSTHIQHFDANWAKFLHAAERILGLRREATSRLSRHLTGPLRCELIHELFFDSYADLEYGLNSPQGRQAGELLQMITAGRVTLLLAEHTEDDIDHLRQYQNDPPASDLA